MREMVWQIENLSGKIDGANDDAEASRIGSFSIQFFKKTS
jgi:hypothetical protein